MGPYSSMAKMPKKIEDHGLFTIPYGTKSYPIGILRDVEVHIGRLKLLTDFYVIDMKKDPETPLLVGRGFPGKHSKAVLDYRKSQNSGKRRSHQNYDLLRGGDVGHERAGGSADMYCNMSQGDWQVRQARWMDQQDEQWGRLNT
ncbi:hypothetical protein Tco_1112487 [Tanacetum coccineum]|uniref:Uncharacterized protein n=1 Tax=Tanacetum coccineum TaxID=301880 RepID=A0ABQ5IPS4_9ASTR